MAVADSTLEQRFWAKVDRSGDCWLWTGCGSGGYGQFRYKGPMVYAHRVAWEQANGPIPDGLDVLHRCDTPRCVNVGHLFLGTHLDNMTDMVAKGRVGRKLDAAQVLAIRADPRTSREVAPDYGVGARQIRRIRARDDWSHLP